MIKKLFVLLLSLFLVESIYLGCTSARNMRTENTTKDISYIRFNGVVEHIIQDSNEYIYFVLANFSSSVQELYCLYPNGSIRWTVKINDSGPLLRGPILDDSGNIYLTTDPGISTPLGGSHPVVLYSISPEGYIRWKFKIGYVNGSSPVVGANGTVFINTGNKLYVIYSNGTIMDIYDLPYPSYGPYLYDNILFFLTEKGIYAIKATDLKLLWFYTTESPPSDVALDEYGNIYVYLNNNILIALNKSGVLLWTLKINATELVGTFEDNVLCEKYELYDTYLYFVGGQNGKISWSIKIKGSQQTSFFADHEGIYLSTYNYTNNTSYLYIISPNGHVKLEIKIPSLITSIIMKGKGSNNMLYVGTNDGRLYMLKMDYQGQRGNDNHLYILIIILLIITIFIIFILYMWRGGK